jgi:hypothetical protein
MKWRAYFHNMFHNIACNSPVEMFQFSYRGFAYENFDDIILVFYWHVIYCFINYINSLGIQYGIFLKYLFHQKMVIIFLKGKSPLAGQDYEVFRADM